MSNIYEINTQDRRYDEASAWIARIDRGLSPDEETGLQAFLADTRNRELFLEMAELWDKMDALGRLAEILPDVERRRRRAPGLAVAASALLAVAAAVWFAVPSIYPGDAGDTAKAAVYETAIGEQSTVSLSDGTVIVLNTDSRMQVRYSQGSRVIDLERGEINVTVARDPIRPLLVHAEASVIQAIGTVFNVEITSGQSVEVIVIEGAVLVGIQNAASDDGEALLSPASATRMTSGSRVVLGQSGEQVERIETDEIEVKLSWTDGNIVFRGESLEDAMTEVGRYTEVEFVFLDERSREVRVAGHFKAGDVEGLLITLQNNFDISYQRIGDDKVLLSSR